MIGRHYVLAWSCAANRTKVQTLDEFISDSRALYSANRAGDWLVVAVGTCADMEATAASIRPTLVARATFPAPNDVSAAA